VGRVVRINSANSDQGVDAIAGFAIDNASDIQSSVAAGIGTIIFLDHTRLVVAGRGVGGNPFLRLYELSDSEAPLDADEHKQDLEVPRIVNGAKVSVPSFHAVARTQPNDRVPDMLVMAAASEGESDGLWKAAVRANTLAELAQFDAIDNMGDMGTIGGIAVGSEGHIVVASARELNSDRSNRLRFLSPLDGRTVMEVPTSLRNIAALAYSPRSGNLYAANSAPIDKGGGVYRIDDGSEPARPACKSVKISEAQRPTALAFGPDGALYVAVLGLEGEGGEDAGALLKLIGDL
jgi:hypothetical protein